MVTRTPEQVMRDWFEVAWSQGRIELIDEIIAPDVIAHNVHDAGGNVVGPAGFRAFITEIRAGFPDLCFSVDDVVADGTKVAGRWTMKGRHTGPFRGLPPTGRPVEITGMAIAIVKDGMVREAWDEWDRLGLLQQLGVVRPAGGNPA